MKFTGAAAADGMAVRKAVLPSPFITRYTTTIELMMDSTGAMYIHGSADSGEWAG